MINPSFPHQNLSARSSSGLWYEVSKKSEKLLKKQSFQQTAEEFFCFFFLALFLSFCFLMAVSNQLEGALLPPTGLECEQ